MRFSTLLLCLFLVPAACDSSLQLGDESDGGAAGSSVANGGATASAGHAGAPDGNPSAGNATGASAGAGDDGTAGAEPAGGAGSSDGGATGSAGGGGATGSLGGGGAAAGSAGSLGGGGAAAGSGGSLGGGGAGGCQGVQVPGDFMTIQEAVDAGSTAICLQSRVYDEIVEISGPAHGISITGQGSKLSSIGVVVLSEADYGSPIVLTDVAVTDGVLASGVANLTLRRCALSASGPVSIPRGGTTNGAALDIDYDVYLMPFALEVADCSLTTTLPSPGPGSEDGTAFRLSVSASDTGQSQGDPCTCGTGPGAPGCFGSSVSIHGNTFDGTGFGALVYLELLGSESQAPPAIADFDGNTFTTHSAGTGLDLHLVSNGVCAPFALAYDGNTFETNNIGIQIDDDAASAGGDRTKLSHSGNILTGNGVDYADQATPD